ncbi:hypothetical protein BGW36DRAFT_396578 [Talaromyces proteolyticus]|uniref:Flavin reductase like domain-containing protein n=1 Tax=Talaromyces proteolyticus TaxID=1131652 RepID=A0AAD4PX50_9EURO|nr:uncharacterized protein BGW36DRAFT_396578 [Talaromyces proteolyticus]KAH8698952.1 hypothetical protein BGW36DRAFT_396578 [Talaromyces proteolyticus]
MSYFYFPRAAAATRAALNCSLRIGARSITASACQHFQATKSNLEGSLPDFDRAAEIKYSKPPNPAWKKGDGANDAGASLGKNHVEIDPYAEGRSLFSNYKLLVSGVVPRPVAFVSTRSKDGQSVNLAPFSYFQVINHDPPLFVVSFVGSVEKAKDTLRNLVDTGECVINIISEHFLDAANATAAPVPYGVSEFGIAGLHPAACSTVQAPRVRESVFSIEGKLVEVKEFESRAQPGKKTSVLAIIEGTRFWAREDAINEDQDAISLDVLRPMSRLGGIQYGRTREIVEIGRPAT